MFLKRNYLRLIGEEVRDSCGSSGTGETPQAKAEGGPPAESECPTFQSTSKLCKP
ncbi:hypothetical protein ACQKOM_09420 [Peribacillus frigoritolerans]|uniref:hypothetical protein n=1 Tax=Peribacillus frigoritolerans TaxID=450367 RepID=UPI00382EACCD